MSYPELGLVQRLYMYRLFPDASSVKQIAGDTLSATELPNPRNTPRQYEAYWKKIDEQETPPITMAVIKHIVEVIEDWKKGVDRKLVLTSLMGVTYEISCQLGKVTHALDKRAEWESGSGRSAQQPSHEIFRGTLITHYGLSCQDQEDGQVPDAVHDYMPISVVYIPLARNILTKEVYRDEPWAESGAANWTLSHLRTKYRTSVTRWRKSSALLRKVEETLKRQDLTRIKKVVIFGGFTMQTTPPCCQKRICNQHGLVEHLGRFIKEQTRGQDVKLFAQDPLYGPLDKSLLGSLSFTVLDDPRGVLEVDESCFVVEIGCLVNQRVVADVTTDVASLRPAGMIWHDLQGGESWTTSARMKNMATEYNAVKLPQEMEISRAGLWLYTRKDIANGVSSGEDDAKPCRLSGRHCR